MIIKNKKTLLLLVFCLLLFFGIGFCVSATQVEWPDSPLGDASITDESELHDLIAYFYGWGISIGVIIAFVMIVIAGIEYMLSSASGNPSLATRALGRIRSAVLGLILLLSSWLILNTINPQITQLQPLPNLWDSDDLISDFISMDRVAEPPCEFVHFYYEEELKGNYIEKAVGIYEEVPEYQSVIGYRKITDEEKEFFKEGEKHNSPDARHLYGDLYIEANSCSVTLYETESKGFLKGKDRCGRASSYIIPTQERLDTSMFEEITCYRVDDISIKKKND